MANAKTPSPAKPSASSQGDTEATAPLIRKQYRNVAVSVWPKTVETADGNKRDTFVCCVTREYRIGEERKRTHYLFPEDLLFAAHALADIFDSLWQRDRNEDE